MNPQRGENRNPWCGKRSKKITLKKFRRAFTNAPALGFPDVMNPFFPYEQERLGTAVGVLTQLLGSWHHPMTYLSKQLDTVS
jgi:hypothetical protein